MNVEVSISGQARRLPRSLQTIAEGTQILPVHLENQVAAEPIRLAL